jgi:ABC-type transport system substrate-binding protein
MATFDLLAQVAASHPNDSLAQSQVAIASFPTVQNEWSGWSEQTPGWLPIGAAERSAVANAMLFSRAPRGLTPFSAAMTAAQSLFANAPRDGRQNVAILLSDGEATDSNPAAVEAQAAALRAAGIKVYVVIYGGSLASNAADNNDQMQRLQSASVNAGLGNWFASNYANFDSYIKALVGNGGVGGLSSTIASGGSNLVELDNVSKLTLTVQSLVSTKALSCSAR